MTNINDFMSTKEAAEFLGLTVGYLYKLTMARKIPYYKPFGNRCYFKRSELEQFLERNRIATAEEAEQHAILYTLSK